MRRVETNGNGTHVLTDERHTAAQNGHASHQHVLSQLREVPRISVWFSPDAHRDGYEAALKDGDTKPNEVRLASLAEKHRAMAQDAFAEEFDPNKREGDRLRQHEFEKTVNEDRPAHEKAVEKAATDVLERERTEAATPPAGEKPEPSHLLVIAAVIVIAMTLTLTMRDSIFQFIDDGMLRWFCAMLTAGVCGVLITYGIVANIESAGRTTTNRVALAGGIVVAIGLAAFRLRDAQGWEEVVFCFALTLVEVGTMILLDSYAAALRRDYQGWVQRGEAKARALAVLEAARVHHGRCIEQLTHTNRAIADHITLVEKRYISRYHIKEIEEALVAAGRDGYLHGIAENERRKLGIREN